MDSGGCGRGGRDGAVSEDDGGEGGGMKHYWRIEGEGNGGF